MKKCNIPNKDSSGIYKLNNLLYMELMNVSIASTKTRRQEGRK
jgi:hypothetical protein